RDWSSDVCSSDLSPAGRGGRIRTPRRLLAAPHQCRRRAGGQANQGSRNQMSVGFSQIPSDLRVPLFYTEVDNSAANTAQASLLRLIVGQVNDDATHEDIGRLTLVSRSDEAASIGGVGSVLHRMHELFRRNDPFGEIWCLPVKITEGVAATGRVSLEGSVTAAGLINLYIAGQRVQVTASLGVSAEVLAGELATAINAAGRLPVKASAAAGVVSLTAKFKGELG